MLTITLALALFGNDCRLGTAIEWEPSVEAAAAKAGKEGKLLLVLHVSGRFEDPWFT